MVRNRHERALAAPPGAAGALIDSLAGPDDRLWPHRRWPAMRFDRPRQVGAVGGHGPIRYTVDQYERGVRIRFRFTAPAGFAGFHEYAVVPAGDGTCVLRHDLVMRTHGPARITWPLVFRPLHDALIEDSLDLAVRRLGSDLAAPSRWSPWVRLLRVVIRRAQRRRSGPGAR